MLSPGFSTITFSSMVTSSLSLYHIIIFLSIVSVFVWLLVAWQRIHLYHERIYLSVLEPYGKALVFILVVAVYLRSLSLAGYVISLHARFFAEEQYVEIDAVSLEIFESRYTEGSASPDSILR